MIVVTFLALAAALVAYAFWVYLRFDLRVGASRHLALLRSATLFVLLLLLFDPPVPFGASDRLAVRQVLVDASTSMQALDGGGIPVDAEVAARIAELSDEGWMVRTFGAMPDGAFDGVGHSQSEIGTRLQGSLRAAAEAGASEVIVLSDLRLADAVSVRAALSELPLDVTFERVGGEVVHGGIASFAVSTVRGGRDGAKARIEVFGGIPGDSLRLEIFEEGVRVADRWLASVAPGLRRSVEMELPVPTGQGRVRYEARITVQGDGFPDDDARVAYATVGYDAGGLVFVSLQPDWEARFLVPVLEEVTGLASDAYLAVADERFVRLGAAARRGPPAEPDEVRAAAAEAALLVVDGLDADSPEWVLELASGAGRVLILPAGPSGAEAAGLAVSSMRDGEWYVSADVPTSPIAGALTDVALQGLPPVTDVIVPAEPVTRPALQLQLRGTGAPESMFAFIERVRSRAVVLLSSGTWRWAMRAEGREPYRRVWSGVAGWLLEETDPEAPEIRPDAWVFDPGVPVQWTVPASGDGSRILILRDRSEIVADTLAHAGRLETGLLPPGMYDYRVVDAAGDTVADGRFDVTPATLEMLPTPMDPASLAVVRAAPVSGADADRMLRTLPWPYLLILALLCAEWVVRRRTGLR